MIVYVDVILTFLLVLLLVFEVGILSLITMIYYID